MADLRKARREAEKSARDALSGTLVGTAGELGVARAAQQEAGQSMTAARAKAAAIIESAEREAAAVIAVAEQETHAADDMYAAAWHEAKNAGWSASQLRGMGYPTAPSRRKVADPAPGDAHSPAAVA